MPRSVLEAIRDGELNFEPETQSSEQAIETLAIPGTHEKLEVLADRVKQGVPLWHPRDRVDYETPSER